MNIEALCKESIAIMRTYHSKKISKKTYSLEEERLKAKTIEFKELFSGKFFILFTTGLTCKHVESL